jgi:hypothetical protein
VTIQGWEQLLAFEERFGLIMGRRKEGECDSDAALAQQDHDHDKSRGDGDPHSGIVHLNVEIEELWSVAYPEGDDDDGSDTSAEDSSYVSSSESEEGDGAVVENEGDLGVEADTEGDDADEDVADEDLMEEHAFEFSELSDFERVEVADDVEALVDQGRVPSLLYRGVDTQTLSILQAGRVTALDRIEFRVYSALRRLLEACALTLERLSLSWTPISTFLVEAVFPVLPELRVLRWDSGKPVSHRMFTNSPVRGRQVPVVFPTLQHLDLVATTDVAALNDVLLLCPGVRTVSLPHDVIQ